MYRQPFHPSASHYSFAGVTAAPVSAYPPGRAGSLKLSPSAHGTLLGYLIR